MIKHILIGLLLLCMCGDAEARRRGKHHAIHNHDRSDSSSSDPIRPSRVHVTKLGNGTDKGPGGRVFGLPEGYAIPFAGWTGTAVLDAVGRAPFRLSDRSCNDPITLLYVER